MNEVQVDYGTLVEVMTEELHSCQSQIIALKAKIKVLDRALTEALDNASPKTTSRKKSVSTDKDSGSY